MVTVTGKLESSANGTAIAGGIQLMLCGYGSRVPRHNGVALVARITDKTIPVAVAGTFSFTVPPNDEIAPAGTYYTVQIKDENGDTAQINAYRFLSVPSTYDLNLIDPYDPNQPPPPLPPLITNLLLIVPGDTNVPNYPGDVYTSFKTVLQYNSTASISGMVSGNLYTFIIVQDGVGGHTFTWPANVHNATSIDLLPNATTIQTFVADENGVLWPIGPATWQ